MAQRNLSTSGESFHSQLQRDADPVRSHISWASPLILTLRSDHNGMGGYVVNMSIYRDQVPIRICMAALLCHCTKGHIDVHKTKCQNIPLMELQVIECPHVLHAFKRQSFPYARLLKVMFFFSPKIYGKTTFPPFSVSHPTLSIHTTWQVGAKQSLSIVNIPRCLLYRSVRGLLVIQYIFASLASLWASMSERNSL